MSESAIAKLRRDEALKTLPDGTEAVPVTLQHQGPMPAIPRAARQQWLRDHFDQIYGADVLLDLESISPSGQTIEALCPVASLGKIPTKMEANQDRLDIIRTRQAQLGE
jgi:hypothetical protein